MAADPIGRRHFLGMAGALAAEGTGAASAPRQESSLPERSRLGGADKVTQLRLSDAGFTCSRQEGGKSLLAGTFTPTENQVVVDVDIAATFGGWGAGYFDFHIGVLPASPPSPWEPGGKNRIVRANNESRSPLPGVTEYQHFVIGAATANAIGTRVGKTLVLDGLAINRVYQWELRSGCLSFYKLCTFPDDAQPTSLALTPDNLYAWVACEGNSRLALLQLGWAELWPLFGYSQEMLCIAEVQLAGKPGGMALQRKGPFLATVDATHHALVLVDTEALAVAGSYAPRLSPALSAQRVCWSADNTKVYVGGADDGALHRFDLARREFDQATVIDSAPGASIIPLDLSSDGRYLWCSSYRSRKILRVDLHSTLPELTLVYTTPPGTFAPTCASVSKSDGSIVFTDPANRVMRHVSADGRLLAAWPISVDAQTSEIARSSVHLDAEQVRAFWTAGSVVGWAWVDSGKVINAVHNWFPDKVYGDVALTENEGTLLALPTSHQVVQWPGGTVYIRPSQNDPTGYGAEHALVTFRGAEATNE